jgi:hypothetical protein
MVDGRLWTMRKSQDLRGGVDDPEIWEYRAQNAGERLLVLPTMGLGL